MATRILNLVAGTVAFAASVACASAEARKAPPPDLDPGRARCVVEAAQRYNVPIVLLRALMRQEGGCGQAHLNTNGTYDYGCMQINSANLSTGPKLSQYGISARHLQFDDCLNIQIGAFMARRHIDASPDFWRGVGAYNSGTYTKGKENTNRRYRFSVWSHVQDIAQGR